MKKLNVLLLSLGLSCGLTQLVHATTQKAVASNSNNQAQQQAVVDDPFANDPFFGSDESMQKAVQSMQQAMKALMNTQFAQLQNNFANQSPTLTANAASNVDIKENQDSIIYTMRLPNSADKKVDVSVKSGQMLITSNVMQKITKESANGKSVSYSQSSNSQAFELPKGYDEKSLSTQMQGDNLIIKLKKIS